MANAIAFYLWSVSSNFNFGNQMSMHFAHKDSNIYRDSRDDFVDVHLEHIVSI